MKLRSGVVATICACSLIASLGAGSSAALPDTGAAIVGEVSTHNLGLESFTFHADIAMAMRHFPWLHFRAQGTGDYRRGDHYVLKLGNMPFTSGSHQIDLSIIDPSLWPHRYRYQDIGERDGNTLFELQALHDPTLRSATVALNPTSAQWADATYSDGTHIHMTIGSNNVDGFLLPVTLDADVDRPHMPMTAQASFGDYDIALATR